MFSNFFFEKSAIYENMLKNIAECGRPQMTIWCMRIACWIPKATNTQTLKLRYTHCLSTATMVARTRLNMTLYVHSMSCLFYTFPKYILQDWILTATKVLRAGSKRDCYYICQFTWFFCKLPTLNSVLNSSYKIQNKFWYNHFTLYMKSSPHLRHVISRQFLPFRLPKQNVV